MLPLVSASSEESDEDYADDPSYYEEYEERVNLMWESHLKRKHESQAC